MAIGHGGLWDPVGNPYLSNGAIAAAHAGGMDGVKIDVRVSSDGVPVLAHSSPIQLYESLDCYSQSIEAMTAAQITACHRFPSTTETFQRLDDVLTYLQGKMVAQLTVKRTQDFARVIQDVNAFGAADFTFFEVGLSDLTTELPAITGWSSVYYLANVSTTPSQIPAVLALANPRIFMIEIDPSVALGTIVTSQLHPAGLRAFTYDSHSPASESEQQGYFQAGYDVVSSNSGANGVLARIAVNQARGVSPP